MPSKTPYDPNALSPERIQAKRWLLKLAFRWLDGLTVFLALYVLLPVLAPILMQVGLTVAEKLCFVVILIIFIV